MHSQPNHGVVRSHPFKRRLGRGALYPAPEVSLETVPALLRAMRTKHRFRTQIATGFLTLAREMNKSPEKREKALRVFKSLRDSYINHPDARVRALAIKEFKTVLQAAERGDLDGIKTH